MKKRGMSLIVLVITIIVMILLSGVTILMSAPKNPIKQAREKAFITDLGSLADRLAEKVGSLEKEGKIDGDSLYAFDDAVEEYIPSFPSKYKGMIGIEGGEIVVQKYNSSNEEIDKDFADWATNAGYKVIPKYYEPPVPSDFTAVSPISDWNSGFIIKDSVGNEFVWVPAMSLTKEYMDGIQIAVSDKFDKCFGTRDYTKVPAILNKFKKLYSLDKVNIDDSTSIVTNNTSLGNDKMIENVEKYGGFYISRYELSMDRKFQKYATMAPGYDVAGIRNALLAYSVERRYTSVSTTMPTASHYDTMLAWFMATGAKNKSAIQISSRSIGNYYYDSLTYKTSETSAGIVKARNTKTIIPAGSCEKTYVNKIADVAGNLPELIQGKVIGSGLTHSFMLRGGSVESTNVSEMSMADIIATATMTQKMSGRLVLYIL